MLSLPGVFRDNGDTPANLLRELNGHLMPCTSCLYGKWAEEGCVLANLEYLLLFLLLYNTHVQKFRRVWARGF